MQSAHIRFLIGLGYATRSKRLRTTALMQETTALHPRYTFKRTHAAMRSHTVKKKRKAFCFFQLFARALSAREKERRLKRTERIQHYPIMILKASLQTLDRFY